MLFSCGKDKSSVSTHVNVKFGAANVTSGGGVIVKTEDSGGAGNTYILDGTNSAESINLDSGDWSFTVFAWSGTTPLSGEAYCGSASAFLENPTETVDISASVAECNNTGYSQILDGAGKFPNLNMQSCMNMTNIVDWDDTCEFPIEDKGEVQSVRFEIVGANGSITSACYGNTGSGNDTSYTDSIIEGIDVRIPFGNTGGINLYTVIHTYADTTCTAAYELLSGEFPSGFHAGELFGIETYAASSTSITTITFADTLSGVGSMAFTAEVPMLHCVSGGTGLPTPCFTDYDLGVSYDSADYDLYMSFNGVGAWHSDESTNAGDTSYDLGTAIVNPDACVVDSWTGFSVTPTCTCNGNAGDSIGSVVGCSIDVPTEASNFVGDGSNFSIDFRLSDDSGSTWTSYSKTVYVYYINVEANRYGKNAWGNQLGSASGINPEGYSSYSEYKHRGFIGDMQEVLGPDLVSGLLYLEGISSCTSIPASGTVSGSKDFNMALASYTMTFGTSSDTFPSGGIGGNITSGVTLDKKIGVSYVLSTGESETSYWWLNCASNVGKYVAYEYKPSTASNNYSYIIYDNNSFATSGKAFESYGVEYSSTSEYEYNFGKAVRLNDAELTMYSIVAGLYSTEEYVTRTLTDISAAGKMNAQNTFSYNYAAAFNDTTTDFVADPDGAGSNWYATAACVDPSTYATLTGCNTPPVAVNSDLFAGNITPAYVVKLVKEDDCIGVSTPTKSQLHCDVESLFNSQ
jgi:hypothetical protein